MTSQTQVIEVKSGTFTRPTDTTAYTSGDLVGNSTTAGSVVPLSFTFPAKRIKLYGAKITKSAAAITNAPVSMASSINVCL